RVRGGGRGVHGQTSAPVAAYARIQPGRQRSCKKKRFFWQRAQAQSSCFSSRLPNNIKFLSDLCPSPSFRRAQAPQRRRSRADATEGAICALRKSLCAPPSQGGIRQWPLARAVRTSCLLISMPFAATATDREPMACVAGAAGRRLAGERLRLLQQATVGG